MADYYSILKKTIASLPESNGAARRSVYSRARTAIVNQLKAYEPPLSPSEITAEQLRLEESIRKVEAEAARESLGLGPAVPKTGTPAAQPAAPAAAAVDQAADPATSEAAAQAAPVEHAPAPVPPEAEMPSPLKDTLSEAQSLGTAANQAVQNAKDAVDPAQDQQSLQSASSERKEPAFDDRSAADEGLFEPAGNDEQSAYDGVDETPSKGREGTSGRTRRGRPSASAALREGGGSRTIPFAIAGVVFLLLVGAGVYFFLPSDDKLADGGAGTATAPAETASAPEVATEEQIAAPVETPEDVDTSKNTDRLLNGGEAEVVAPDARTVTTTTINPEEPSASGADGTPVAGNVESEPASVAPLAPETPLNPIDTPAIVGEPAAVPQDNLAAIAPEEATPSEATEGLDPGVQRSILYEEGEEAGGAGTAAQGAVVWSVEEETDLDGRAQAVLSASVEIPERDVKVDIRIKPNDDTSLPASHLVEIKYEFPETFAAGDVVNVPGLVMKPTEEARGDALIGASVKVSPGFFWIALSSLPNEQQRNLALLRERGWIDIPMLYENGKRGILTLEKGSDGEEAVEKAVSAWQAG